MAGDGRTEQPTQRRREEARKEGRIAHSREIGAALGLLGVLGVLRFGGRWMWQVAERAMQQGLGGLEADFSPTGLVSLVKLWLVPVAAILGPVFGCVVLVVVVAGLAQTRGLLSAKPLAPDWQRVSPLAGSKRLFSRRTPVELVKTVAKVAAVGFLIYCTLEGQSGGLPALSQCSVPAAAAYVAGLCFRACVWVALALVVVAGADYAFQWLEMEKSLRMTRQELRDELKETEGDPQMRSRVRQLRRRTLEQRTERDTERATVVVTNPTRVAVALRYEASEMTAPVVLAKGQRRIAERIIEIAREHGVPVRENAPLARALFASVEIGEQIPEELYKAVAEVLAWVYRQAERRRERQLRRRREEAE